MCHVSADNVMGTNYQTSTLRAMFGNVRVFMAWCEKNSGGGHKKGVCITEGGKLMKLSIVGGSDVWNWF